jgi:hypothetical protein
MHAKTELAEGREFNAVKLDWNEERRQFEVVFMGEFNIEENLNL